MKKLSLMNLYFIFFKIGAILLGGGYVILPILTNEFTKKRTLLSEDDIIDYFALSQSLPGIIAANISMFIGYRLHGKLGAFLAMLGVISAPFFSIVLLAAILNNLVESPFIQGAFWGIGVAVLALILLTIREMWQKCTKDLFFYFILTLSLFTLIYFDLTPVKTILLFTFIGVLYKRLALKKEAK